MTDQPPASALLLATTLVVSVVVGASAHVTIAGASVADGTANTHTTDTLATDPDAEIENGSGYWVGQTLSTDAYDTGATVELFQRDSDAWVFRSQIRVNDSGMAVVDTAGLDIGQYELRSESGRNLRFTLRQQSLAVAADTGPVSTEPDVSPETTFRFESNRNEYRLAVLTGELTPAEIEAVLGVDGQPYDADDDGDASEQADGLVVTNRTFGTESTLDANFSGRDTGTYEFSFVVTDTGTTANTTVNVSHADPPPAAFAQGRHTLTVGETTTVVVEVPGNATMTVAHDDGFEATVTLRDVNDDGTVPLRIEATDGGSLSFAAASSDTVTVDRNGSAVGAGEYELDVRAGLDAAAPAEAVGTLVVERTGTPGTTATAGIQTTQSTTAQTTPEMTDKIATTVGPTTQGSTTAADGGTPGFGLVTAVVGVLAGALLAGRAD